jgi:hypothetical protein
MTTMADVRTLKLNLLADVDQFGRSLAKADDDAKGFTKKLGKYGKMAAAAFTVAAAAAGAYAIKLGVDGVQAAIEDEKSQATLVKTMQNVIGATNEQIAANEKYITSTQFRTGVSDVKQRVGLARLVRSTKDLTEAQRLSTLATEIAAGTGKDYETVVMALAKANDGQFGALKKLGITLGDNAENATKYTKENEKLAKLQNDLNEKLEEFGPASDEYVKAQEKVAEQQVIVNDLGAAGVDWVGELSKEFAGSATAAAQTYAGQMAILKERLGEFQESIGAKLLPVMGELLTMVTNVAKGFGGEDPEGLSNRARELAGNFEGDGSNSLGGALRAVVTAFSSLFTVLTDDGDEATTTMGNFADALESVANGINSIAAAYKASKDTFKDIKETALGQFLFGRYGPDGMFPGLLNPSGARAAGGPVAAGGVYRVGEFGPELFVSNGASGSIRPDNGGQGVTIIMNGVIDGESARRSIERLLQDSARRTGAINLVGATL